MLPMKKQPQFFKEKEFACKCGCGAANMDKDFVSRLDNARRIAGIPFHINSGFRCMKHNANVGGVKESSHVFGFAADIGVSDSPSRYKIVNALLTAGFSRIGVGMSLIHVDSDPSKEQGVIWVYDGK